MNGLIVTDHADGAAWSQVVGGQRVKALIYRKPGESQEAVRARAAKVAHEYAAEVATGLEPAEVAHA